VTQKDILTLFAATHRVISLKIMYLVIIFLRFAQISVGLGEL